MGGDRMAKDAGFKPTAPTGCPPTQTTSSVKANRTPHRTPPFHHRSALVSKCSYQEAPATCEQLAAQGTLPKGVQSYEAEGLTGAFLLGGWLAVAGAGARRAAGSGKGQPVDDGGSRAFLSHTGRQPNQPTNSSPP